MTADRGEPVRHHLPRALLLLLADRGRGDLRRPRHDDLRRRGAVDARRLAAHLRAPRRRRRAARSSERVLELRAARGGGRLPRRRDLRALRRAVRETKRKLLELLIEAKRAGKRIVGYGAPGKGNTLLNYCGIRQDFLDFTVDRNPYKHGQFLPGTHIPIFAPEKTRRGASPTTSSSCPGTSRTRSWSSSPTSASWGGEVHRADPRSDGGLNAADALLGAGRARRCACSASAPTATTSRSAAAARCCGCSPSARARRSTGWCFGRRRARARGAGERGGIPGRRGDDREVVDASLPRELLPLRRRRGQGRFERAEGRPSPDLVFDPPPA